MMPLNGKVILLTGASGGLGSVVTPILSGAGATLIIVDRSAVPRMSLTDGVDLRPMSRMRPR